MSTDPADADYTVVGHVSVDRLPDGRRQAGGAAFYSGLQAARLGLRTRIITAGVEAELEELLDPVSAELEVEVQPRTETTSFAATWIDGRRVLRLDAWAGAIDPPAERSPADRAHGTILHLAPIANELPRGWARQGMRFARSYATPQGMIRRWDTAGNISRVELDPELLPRECEAIVVSASELPHCAATAEAVASRGVAVVTHGAAGVELHARGRSHRQPPAAEIAAAEDLGAGDVFAAALFAELARGADPLEAARFGQTAAALRLAGSGPYAIATRAEIEQALS